MNDVENLLDELPYRITKKLQGRCTTCGNEFESRTAYELQIDIFLHETSRNVIKKRYRIYYRSPDYYMFGKDKIIECNTGLGYKTIKEAVENLKTYLKSEDIKNG